MSTQSQLEESNARQKVALGKRLNEIRRLEGVKDDLLAALEDIIAYHPYAKCDGRISVSQCTTEPCSTAKAAIAKTKEQS